MKPLALSLTVPALVLTAALARSPRPDAALIGTRLPDFRGTTVSGEPFHFYSLAGKKAAVFYVLGADCPIAKLSLPKLAALAKRYESKGVAFIGINPNGSENEAQTIAALKVAGAAFPTLADRRQELADRLKVTRTGEVLVVDGNATLRYRGAPDDQYGLGSRKPAPRKTYLTDALDALLAGKPVPTESSDAPGCLIDRTQPTVAADAEPAPLPEPVLPKVGKVTYAEHVAPILQEKCESCHRPGQVGPFPLQDFSQARRWSAMIGETVQTKRMPPWHADPRHGDFQNDRSLTPKEKATVLAWVKQGAPEGNLKKLPAKKSFTPGWNIGKPDVVLKMDKPFSVPATGVMNYQWFRVPTDFLEDKWIQAAEVKPSARSAVHHVLVFLSQGGRIAANGLDGFIAEYVPGESPMVFPEGIAKKLPKGMELLFQVHYTPTGVAQTDQTELGLVFAKEKPKAEADTIGIVGLDLRIPPGKESHKVARTFTTPADCTVYSYSPHMHVRGKAFRMSATYPDGKSETLLSVPKYDFNWQTRYLLKEPKKLPKGTQIAVEAWYDNSTKNPNNPDATKTVTWGEQTFEEMMIGFIDMVIDGDQGGLFRMENFLNGSARRRNRG